MKVSRRKLLIAGSVAGVAPAFIVSHALASSPEDVIVRYIRSRTGNTTIPEPNLYQFAGKFVANYRNLFGRKFDAAMVIMDNDWSTTLLGKGRRVAFEAFERTLLTDFLFSTDFFTEAGQDPQRMSYVDYADAYTIGCRNPLARFELEA